LIDENIKAYPFVILGILFHLILPLCRKIFEILFPLLIGQDLISHRWKNSSWWYLWRKLHLFHFHFSSEIVFLSWHFVTKCLFMFLLRIISFKPQRFEETITLFVSKNYRKNRNIIWQIKLQLYSFQLRYWN